MKWIPETRTLELTQRNITALTDKLDDPLSARTLISPCGGIAVTATETPGVAEAVAAPGCVLLARAQLTTLAKVGAVVRVGNIRVRAVTDDAHYACREVPPGVVYMPSTEEVR